MQFEKVDQPKRKSAVVVEQILAAISSGELPRGSRLPSERELSDQMHVSRNSVREALAALQLIGILETKTGAGSFVAVSGIPNADVPAMLDQLRGEEDLVKVWEARTEIEVSLARLVAQRADASCLTRIRRSLEKLAEAIEANVDVDDYLLLNAAFHASIASCADNRPMADAYAILEESTRAEMLRVPHRAFIRNGMRVSQADHEAILEAIATGDADLADRAVRIHYGGLERYIRSQFIGDGQDGSAEEGDGS